MFSSQHSGCVEEGSRSRESLWEGEGQGRARQGMAVAATQTGGTWGQRSALLGLPSEPKHRGGHIVPWPMSAPSVLPTSGTVSVHPSRVLMVNIRLKETCKTLSFLLLMGCWFFVLFFFFPFLFSYFPLHFFLSFRFIFFPISIDCLVSCSRSTLAPCPHRAPSGTGGARGFEARRGNRGTLQAASCWGETGCRSEVHTAAQWVGEKLRSGAGTCYGCLLSGGTCGWPRC